MTVFNKYYTNQINTHTYTNFQKIKDHVYT